MTYELHVIRAHLLHYTTLLLDFKKSVIFIRDTHNPVMEHDSVAKEQRRLDKELLDRECGHLLLEIERLEMNRQLQDDRVQNVKHLVIYIHLLVSCGYSLTATNLGICHGQYRRQ